MTPLKLCEPRPAHEPHTHVIRAVLHFIRGGRAPRDGPSPPTSKADPNPLDLAQLAADLLWAALDPQQPLVAALKQPPVARTLT